MFVYKYTNVCSERVFALDCGTVSNFKVSRELRLGSCAGEGAAAGSCVGAAPKLSEGAATARRQISNVSEGAAPPKFDKKFQIFMGAAKEI